MSFSSQDSFTRFPASSLYKLLFEIHGWPSAVSVQISSRGTKMLVNMVILLLLNPSNPFLLCFLKPWAPVPPNQGIFVGLVSVLCGIGLLLIADIVLFFSSVQSCVRWCVWSVPKTDLVRKPWAYR